MASRPLWDSSGTRDSGLLEYNPLLDPHLSMRHQRGPSRRAGRAGAPGALQEPGADLRAGSVVAVQRSRSRAHKLRQIDVLRREREREESKLLRDFQELRRLNATGPAASPSVTLLPPPSASAALAGEDYRAPAQSPPSPQQQHAPPGAQQQRGGEGDGGADAERASRVRLAELHVLRSIIVREDVMARLQGAYDDAARRRRGNGDPLAAPTVASLVRSAASATADVRAAVAGWRAPRGDDAPCIWHGVDYLAKMQQDLLPFAVAPEEEQQSRADAGFESDRAEDAAGGAGGAEARGPAVLTTADGLAELELLPAEDGSVHGEDSGAHPPPKGPAAMARRESLLMRTPTAAVPSGLSLSGRIPTEEDLQDAEGGDGEEQQGAPHSPWRSTSPAPALQRRMSLRRHTQRPPERLSPLRAGVVPAAPGSVSGGEEEGDAAHARGAGGDGGRGRRQFPVSSMPATAEQLRAILGWHEQAIAQMQQLQAEIDSSAAEQAAAQHALDVQMRTGRTLRGQRPSSAARAQHSHQPRTSTADFARVYGGGRAADPAAAAGAAGAAGAAPRSKSSHGDLGGGGGGGGAMMAQTASAATLRGSSGGAGAARTGAAAGRGAGGQRGRPSQQLASSGRAVLGASQPQQQPQQQPVVPEADARTPSAAAAARAGVPPLPPARGAARRQGPGGGAGAAPADARQEGEAGGLARRRWLDVEVPDETQLRELRLLDPPPPAAVLALAATLILLEPGQSVPADLGWDTALKVVLRDAPALVSRLRAFSPAHLPRFKVRALRSFVSQPQFRPEELLPDSRAAAGLCAWVLRQLASSQRYLDWLAEE